MNRSSFVMVFLSLNACAPAVAPGSDAGSNTTPDADVVVIVSPTNDASSDANDTDATTNDAATNDVVGDGPPVSMSGRTSCIVSVPSFGVARCYEYAYAHSGEVTIRSNECNRLATAGNTTEFHVNVACPREASVGCCENADRSVVQCFYAPVHQMSIVMMQCSGSFHYVAP